MKKLLQVILVTLVGAISLVFIGAGCVQDAVTPAYVSESAAEWAGVPTKMFLPYTSLWDAKRVGMAIDYKLTIERIKGGYYKNVTNLSILAGEELKNTVFAPDGLLSLLLIGGPFTALGAYAISKPKDKKEIEALKNGKS
jgi:hypothetical protein